jgi:hypothetical protein
MESRKRKSSSMTAINGAFDIWLTGASANPVIRGPDNNIGASAREFRNLRVRIPLRKVFARKLWHMRAYPLATRCPYSQIGAGR